MPDFLPRRDADLVPFLGNFSLRISASPQEFGLSSEQAAHFASLFATFEQAYRTSSAPATRTQPSIRAKDDAREAAIKYVRTLAALVRGRLDTSAASAMLLGLKRPKKTRTRIARPATAPLLSVTRVIGSRITLRLRDADSFNRVAKPRGASGAIILSFAGEHPPADLGKWRVMRNTSVTQADIDFGVRHPPGTKVWFSARWYNPTGRFGPSSAPVYTWIAHGEMFLGNQLKQAA